MRGLPQRPWLGGLFGAVLVVLVENTGLSRWFIVLGVAAFTAWAYWDWYQQKREERQPRFVEGD